MKKIVVEYALLVALMLLFNLIFRWTGWLSDLSYLFTFFLPLGFAVLSDCFGRLKRKWRVSRGKPEWKENEFRYSGGEVLTALLEDAFHTVRKKWHK